MPSPKQKTQCNIPSAWCETYRSAGDNKLNLTTSSAHDLAELLADTGEKAEAVVLGEGGKEVLDGLLGAGAGLLGELGDDGGLVLGAQGRRGQDGGQLGILADEGLEAGQSLGRGVEGGGLDSGGVLW